MLHCYCTRTLVALGSTIETKMKKRALCDDGEGSLIVRWSGGACCVVSLRARTEPRSGCTIFFIHSGNQVKNIVLNIILQSGEKSHVHARYDTFIHGTRVAVEEVLSRRMLEHGRNSRARSNRYYRILAKLKSYLPHMKWQEWEYGEKKKNRACVPSRLLFLSHSEKFIMALLDFSSVRVEER